MTFSMGYENECLAYILITDLFHNSIFIHSSIRSPYSGIYFKSLDVRGHICISACKQNEFYHTHPPIGMEIEERYNSENVIFNTVPFIILAIYISLMAYIIIQIQFKIIEKMP